MHSLQIYKLICRLADITTSERVPAFGRALSLWLCMKEQLAG